MQSIQIMQSIFIPLPGSENALWFLQWLSFTLNVTMGGGGGFGCLKYQDLQINCINNIVNHFDLILMDVLCCV